MIIKYAYSYANPTGTFYVGTRDGVTQHKLTAQAMSSIAAQEGGVLSWLRRTLYSQIGSDELFELVNVTPQKITNRGIYTGEEVKELYELVKFDPNLDSALKSYAKQVHEAYEESRDHVADVKMWIKGLVKADVIVDATVDEKDPHIVNVSLKIPLPYFEVTIKGVQDGSQDRS